MGSMCHVSHVFEVCNINELALPLTFDYTIANVLEQIKTQHRREREAFMSKLLFSITHSQTFFNSLIHSSFLFFSSATQNIHE